MSLALSETLNQVIKQIIFVGIPLSNSEPGRERWLRGIKALALRPDDLSSIPGTDIKVEEKK